MGKKLRIQDVFKAEAEEFEQLNNATNPLNKPEKHTNKITMSKTVRKITKKYDKEFKKWAKEIN